MMEEANHKERSHFDLYGFNHGLSKTPDLILTFFIGQYILYAFS